VRERLLAMRAERPHESGHQPNHANRLWRLRLDAVSVPIGLLLHATTASFEIDVRPGQPQGARPAEVR